MTQILSRAERRQMERENAKRPAVLTEVPREQWPERARNPNLRRVWLSRDFLVQELDEPAPVLVRLSVNRTSHNGARWVDGITWDELQRIKNEVGYADHDAVEVYPRERDTVNVSAMRHLFVMRELMPFTWRDRRD